MTLQPFVPGLVVAMVASIAVMVWAAGEGNRALTSVGALGFSIAVVLICLLINVPLWRRRRRRDPSEAIHASRRNARLMSMVYAWGAAALFAIYSLTELWWWHSWQYGLAMAFVACGLLAYAERMKDLTSALVQPRALDATAVLALLQGGAVAAGLAFLIGSGKLASSKPDWPANHVFIGGGVALALVSLIAVYTHRRLRRAATPDAEQQSSSA